MSAITTSTIDKINSEHRAALHRADQAIEHAKRAGELLMRVKAELPHGEFLPWIDATLEVSRRQAQRYMRAAQGKRMTARKIKSDTASHLGWLPDRGLLATAVLRPDAHIEIQAVPHAPEFYQFVFMNGLTVDYTRRGLRPDDLEKMLVAVVPPMMTCCAFDGLEWSYQPASDSYLAGTIKRLEAMTCAPM